MRLILDTHILLALLTERLLVVAPSVARALGERDVDACASVESLWEIAMKTRLGKLDPGMSLDLLPESLETMGVGMLPITASHALAPIEPLPPTRDPFDRLLLAQCALENRQLVTIDRALVGHPLAARFD
ncbi:type II toxin-antitoxin system VapC family toxin [Methylobacterium sp. NEAU 140]|uniref:type II toxin-antitoxin system VapC family toxin n=1 Tax=Methylobacterium sp. NEAU 140 TaxID=3064945 RepID=UPI002737548D|nr:type II toxin-antitoxin system VapC family toxin [Methylobacterium sp. NEAU 140]MDP4023247.1 type II toxin-antitoxin system VapC family toxin [Methylobacterium sp. NEAU 140]